MQSRAKLRSPKVPQFSCSPVFCARKYLCLQREATATWISFVRSSRHDLYAVRPGLEHDIVVAFRTHRQRLGAAKVAAGTEPVDQTYEIMAWLPPGDSFASIVLVELRDRGSLGSVRSI